MKYKGIISLNLDNVEEDEARTIISSILFDIVMRYEKEGQIHIRLESFDTLPDLKQEEDK